MSIRRRAFSEDQSSRAVVDINSSYCIGEAALCPALTEIKLGCKGELVSSATKAE